MDTLPAKGIKLLHLENFLIQLLINCCVSSAFISLVELNLAPAWMVVIIVGREFAVSGIRSIALSKGYLMPANMLGKLKTVCQVCTIVVLIVADTYIEPWERFGRFLLWVTVAISLISAANYLKIFLRIGSSRTLTNGKEEIDYADEREERKQKIVS